MLIPKVIRLLKPFSDATLDAEHEYACISDTIPLIKKIFYELNAIDEFGIGTMKNEMVVQMNRYFRGQDPRVHFIDVEVSEVHAVATLLDPRYKTSGFMDKVKAEEAKVKLTSFASNIIEGSPAQTSFEIEANSSANSCWDEILSDSDDKFDSVSNSTIGGEMDTIRDKVKKEIFLYFADKRIPRELDPLWYWRMNLNLYPIFRYLSSPCGSVPSEREFKIASKISQGDRIRLLPPNIEKLLFLKYNLRTIGFGSFKLPQPPPEVDLPNRNSEIDDESSA